MGEIGPLEYWQHRAVKAEDRIATLTVERDAARAEAERLEGKLITAQLDAGLVPGLKAAIEQADKVQKAQRDRIGGLESERDAARAEVHEAFVVLSELVPGHHRTKLVPLARQMVDNLRRALVAVAPDGAGDRDAELGKNVRALFEGANAAELRIDYSLTKAHGLVLHGLVLRRSNGHWTGWRSIYANMETLDGLFAEAVSRHRDAAAKLEGGE